MKFLSWKNKENVTLDRTVNIDGLDIFVGKFTYGHRNIKIHTWKENTKLTIGRYCSIAGNIEVFLGGNHKVDWVSTYPFGHVYQDDLPVMPTSGHPQTNGDVQIGNDVWIGYGAKILSGVHIGDGAVVGAHSLVTKSVPSYGIVGGNPAILLKQRFDRDMVDVLTQLKWWEFETSKVIELTSVLSSQPNIEVLLKMLDESKTWLRS